MDSGLTDEEALKLVDQLDLSLKQLLPVDLVSSNSAFDTGLGSIDKGNAQSSFRT